MSTRQKILIAIGRAILRWIEAQRNRPEPTTGIEYRTLEFPE